MKSRTVPHGQQTRRNWLDKSGSWHRFGGPAVEYTNGDKSWYWHGVPMYEEMNGIGPDENPVTVCSMPTPDDPPLALVSLRFVLDQMKENFCPPGYSKPERELRR
jgi:hypothetical protein